MATVSSPVNQDAEMLVSVRADERCKGIRADVLMHHQKGWYRENKISSL
jgi:hypothetical protein